MAVHVRYDSFVQWLSLCRCRRGSVKFLIAAVNPVRAWRLNHALRDAQNVCALTKVGTILKLIQDNLARIFISVL